jgi:hypothetical protein
VSENQDIAELIPLLVTGKLEDSEADTVRSRIAESSRLQAELEFWQGVYAIRDQLQRLDFSEHPTPEALDRFARGEIDKLAPEFSEIASHLSQCHTCAEDLALIRKSLADLPDEPAFVSGTVIESWWQRLLTLVLTPRWATAAAASLAILLIVSFTAYQPLGDLKQVRAIVLRPQFESRNVSADGTVPEQEFPLHASEQSLVFEFTTDRVDVENMQYLIELIPDQRSPIIIPGESVNCTQTEMTNQCRINVSDPGIMRLLHSGGSFSISIRELLPTDVDLEPAEYNYHFRVLVDE